MPVCRKCSAEFPNWLFIKEKKRNLRNRKYCLVCSPFGQHNTLQLEKPRKINVVCMRCKRTYSYKRNRGHTKTKCNSCQTSEQRFKRKRKILEYKGGKCQICGYDKCIQALGFHHINPENKSFKISGNLCRSWESIKKELEKCVLLCANCHAEVHAGLIKINIGA